RPSQFRAAPPPALTSRRYARDYNEVKAVGALNNSSRTPEQTDLAHFFAGNTLVIWNRALRDIAVAHVDNVADSARLFALADLAIADALITSWNDKTHYVFWRPITAIREGDNDGNPRTAGDPDWLSLVINPPYPDYTSGAVNFATATTRTLEHFFGTDHMTFSVTTTNLGPTVEDTRTYRRFSHAAQDVVDARVYSGIHFRFADEAAQKQGRQVADWAFRNFMRPLNNDGDRWGDDDDHNGHR
ncbi:MAG: vanadium-dependent haloperoxidase, partial [Acidobacteria bacterium]|nr:vanadium-dependent haloperoxidase [Acidobacteriota bacterium]